MLAPRQTKPLPRSIGRYDYVGDEFRPASLGRPPPSQNIRTSVIAVPDPWTPGKRVLATVNRRTSILEDERAHRNITEAAYQAGLLAMAIFGLARGPGTSNWQGGSRVDASTASELAVIHGIDDARKIVAYTSWVRNIVGLFDCSLVVRILCDRKSYSDIATQELKFGDRGRRYIANRFRDALEQLAESSAARGAEHYSRRK